MNEKYDGASKICTQCNSVLTCRMSNYKNIPNKLQWQNQDGSAHYKYKGENEDGKGMFECSLVTSGAYSKPRAKDFKQCGLCEGTHFGYYNSEASMKQHIKIFHPNGEKLTMQDYKLEKKNNVLVQSSNKANTGVE